MKTIKNFDFFRKSSADIIGNKTLTGGIITLISLIVILALITYEFYSIFLGDPLTFSYIENHQFDDKIKIHLNISFHKTPCQALSVDYQDITGTHIQDIQFDLFKLRLDKNGNYLDNQIQQIYEISQLDIQPSVPILFQDSEKQKDSCYGAELYVGQRCYSCSDVMMAYEARSWPQPPRETIIQCSVGYKSNKPKKISKKEQEYKSKLEKKLISEIHDQEDKNQGISQQNSIKQKQQVSKRMEFSFEMVNFQIKNNIATKQTQQKPSNRRMLYQEDYGQDPDGLFFLSDKDIQDLQQQIGEGCQIYGNLEIKKIPGNFHISLHGKGFASFFINQRFDLDHTIHQLEFTQVDEATTNSTYLLTNPLDNTNCQLPESQDAIYYLKIVNSKFQHILSGDRNLYLFSANKMISNQDPMVPAVTFKYEFDPVTMLFYHRNNTYLGFFTQIFGIISGVFMVSNMMVKYFG